VLGGGVAGANAARMAMGLEAWVTVIDKSLPRLYELDLQFGSELHTLYSTVENIENEVLAASRPNRHPMINHVAIVAVPQQRRAPKGVSVVRTGLGGPIRSRRRAPCPSISCPTSP
jgi:alanine dehydrogenase